MGISDSYPISVAMVGQEGLDEVVEKGEFRVTTWSCAGCAQHKGT